MHVTEDLWHMLQSINGACCREYAFPGASNILFRIWARSSDNEINPAEAVAFAMLGKLMPERDRQRLLSPEWRIENIPPDCN